MTVAYYHGAPGSFKTASMVRDWLLPALGITLPSVIGSIFGSKPKQGNVPNRHVYTNIRGVTPTDYVHVVDNKVIVNSLFTAEKGSLFLIDEVGQVFDDYDAKKTIFSDSSLQSDENGTIEVIDTLAVVFDKHRHFGYDIIGTAPSHKRIPVFFQNIAEYGYKHKALASMGLKGFYNQAEHIGTDTGSNSSQFTRLRMLRMHKSVFGFYQSTATGDHKESAITSSFLRHPLIIFGVPLIAITFYYSFTSFTFFDRIKDESNTENFSSARLVTAQVSNTSAVSSQSGYVDPQEIITASAYLDRLLYHTKYFIRLAFVSESHAFFSFGDCNKNVLLNFRRSNNKAVVSSSDHPSFAYDFDTDVLSFSGMPVYFSFGDCPIKDDTNSIQDNLFGKPKPEYDEEAEVR